VAMVEEMDISPAHHDVIGLSHDACRDPFSFHVRLINVTTAPGLSPICQTSPTTNIVACDVIAQRGACS